MSFDKLLHKVKQAEDALEAQERRMSADWRQLKRSWQASWTPGRIIVVGLLSGFAVGRVQPARVASGSGVLRLLASLGTLLASGQAQVAAGEAEEAAQTAGHTAEEAAEAVGARAPTATAEAFEP
jgi:hypothetical protein